MAEIENSGQKLFQEVIVQIIENHGKENEFDMKTGVREYILLEHNSLMDFCIRRISDSRLEITHRKSRESILRSDIVDPRVVFEISEDPWLPVVYEVSDWIYNRDPDGLDMDGFLRTWAKNLNAQGFSKRTDGLPEPETQSDNQSEANK